MEIERIFRDSEGDGDSERVRDGDGDGGSEGDVQGDEGRRR